MPPILVIPGLQLYNWIDESRLYTTRSPLDDRLPIYGNVDRAEARSHRLMIERCIDDIRCVGLHDLDERLSFPTFLSTIKPNEGDNSVFGWRKAKFRTSNEVTRRIIAQPWACRRAGPAEQRIAHRYATRRML